MFKKKLEVIDINKQEENIILEEKLSKGGLFLKRNRGLILLALLLIAIITISIGSYYLIKSINNSNNINIVKAELESDLNDYNHYIDSRLIINESGAIDKFKNTEIFKTKGEVLLVKNIESSKFLIRLYSDGTAIKIMKNNNLITRINPLEDGSYGINNNGDILTTANVREVRIIDTKEYSYGFITYYSDGSAMITNSKKDIFVRDANDIKENYISNNKVSYQKEINNNKEEFYDGTILENEIIKRNNNNYNKYKTIKLDDGLIIDYYEDGSAIIKEGSKKISVRKSNSIIIKNNKLYEIVDNIYVDIAYQDNNIINYTNGGAVVKYNNSTYYMNENSDIKKDNNNITSIGTNIEKLSNETNINNEHIQVFEKIAVVEKDNTIMIVPKEGIVYDKEGLIKDIENINSEEKDINSFNISNNTNKKLNYRIVIENSSKTNLDIEYLRYQLMIGTKYITPKKLDNKWNNDNIYKLFNINKEHYILYEDTIEAYDRKNIKMMLWTDYDTIPNSMQNKYFYGTIKVFAWTDK